MGTEVEGRFTYNDNLNMSLNYSYHHVSQSDNTGLLPEHMIKALFDWKFTKDWMIGSQLSWVGERKRQANDPRPNLSNYFIAGVTLSTKVAKPLELTLRVNNVFGANAKEPSVAPTLLPGDLPVNDLSVLGQIKWSF
jgi:iron complex outermembrane receptor protein